MKELWWFTWMTSSSSAAKLSSNINHCSMCPWHPLQASALPQGWEMYVLTVHGRVSQPYPLWRSCRNGPHKGGWHLWLANPEKGDWSPVLHLIHQLLPDFHTRLLICGQAPTSSHQERQSVAMDLGWTEGLQGLQVTYDVTTHPCAAWPRCAISAGNGCIWVCHWHHPISTVWGQQVVPNRINVQEPITSWKELQNLWQGTSIGHVRSGRMDAHPGRNYAHDRDPEWP